MEPKEMPGPQPSLPKGFGQYVTTHLGEIYWVTCDEVVPVIGPPSAPTHEQTVQHWLDEMTEGIAEHPAILAAILPRVAPEIPVVALATQRLLRALHSERGWRVYLEHPLPTKRAKCDLIVQRPESEHPRATHFEWKALWPNGCKECIDGLRADKEKLAELPHGTAYVVAFAYAVERAPAECALRLRGSRPKLEETVHHATSELGEPFFKSRILDIADLGIVAEAQVVAWSATAL